MVTLIAGKGTTIHFQVHEFVIRLHSSSLVGDINNDNDAGKILFLEDVEPYILDAAISWMYTKTLVVSTIPEVRYPIPFKTTTPDTVVLELSAEERNERAEENTDDVEEKKDSNDSSNIALPTPSRNTTPTMSEVTHSRFSVLLDLYIFASTYGFRELRNEIMKQWQLADKNVDKLCGTAIVSRAYELLPKECPLLDFIAMSYASSWTYLRNAKDRAEFDRHASRFPSGFISDVLHFTATTDSKNRKAYLKNPCKFHEHLDEQEKRACRAAFLMELNMPQLKIAQGDLKVLRKRVADHSDWVEQATAKGCRIHKRIKVDDDNLFIGIS